MKNEDKLTSYAQVCEKENVDPILSLPFPNVETEEQDALNAVVQSWRIVRVFNKQVKPDYDKSGAKYSAWWNMRSESIGGPGFSYDGCDFGVSASSGGARLVFLDFDTMKWVTSQPEFVAIFKRWMTFTEL